MPGKFIVFDNCPARLVVIPFLYQLSLFADIAAYTGKDTSRIGIEVVRDVNPPCK